MPELPERTTDRIALGAIAIVVAIVIAVMAFVSYRAQPRAEAQPAGLPTAPASVASRSPVPLGPKVAKHDDDHEHPEKPGVKDRAVLFTETFRHDDGLRVTVKTVDHGQVSAKDAHGQVKPHEDYVQLQVRVTNGGHHAVEGMENLWILSYGKDGQDAIQPRLRELAHADKAMKGTLKPGQSRTARQTFVVPCLCQDRAVLEFTFDQEGHQPSVFTGEIS